MLILGIETSCDETPAAVVQDGRRALSNVVASQVDIHREYGGVVPEVAARSHIEVILPVIHEALAIAGVSSGIMTYVVWSGMNRADAWLMTHKWVMVTSVIASLVVYVVINPSDVMTVPEATGTGS
jgi:tRNA N6-adenosine threonylcarbamoyltransferase